MRIIRPYGYKWPELVTTNRMKLIAIGSISRQATQVDEYCVSTYPYNTVLSCFRESLRSSCPEMMNCKGCELVLHFERY